VRVHAYQGNVEQKNVALAEASGDWILALDADEALTPELAREIQELLRDHPETASGYRINRVTWHLGRWIRHGEFFPDWQLRLFQRAAGSWEGKNPHGRVRVRGVVDALQGELQHFSYRDLADQVERIQDFSDIQAAGNQERGRSVGWSDLWLRPPARFLRAYLLKQGFRDGVPGFVIAMATAFHVFLKYAKQWELSHVGPPGSATRGKAARQVSEAAEAPAKDGGP
jgi:glycosyltransferase involved in cell wall biosynthesis